MAQKSEYGSTPDMEKGGFDEDKPQKWWCFHATRRVMRTILVLIPLLALTAFDVYASYESMTSHVDVHEDIHDDHALVNMAEHAMISFWSFVALLIWIPTVWLLIGWAEPFPKYLQLWVVALLVYLPIMYHFEVERMNSDFTSQCDAYKVRELDCDDCYFMRHWYLARHHSYPECSKDTVKAADLMSFIIRVSVHPKRKHDAIIKLCSPETRYIRTVLPCAMIHE